MILDIRPSKVLKTSHSTFLYADESYSMEVILIFGFRIENEMPNDRLPAVKDVYEAIRKRYVPQRVLFGDSPYIECTVDESDELEELLEKHQSNLSEGWICWNEVLINKYLGRVLTATPSIMYRDEAMLQERVPRFHEMKWDIAYNQCDSNQADLFMQQYDIAMLIPLIFNCKPVEFPGLFNNLMAIPMY